MKHVSQVVLAGLILCLGTVVSAVQGDPPKAPPLPSESERSKLVSLDKAPADVGELKAIQKQVKAVLEKVLPATVGIEVEIKSGPQRGLSAGSGVIVNEEGYILTAAHVSGEANKPCTIILPGNRRVKGLTLGRNNSGIDSGMVKIVETKKEKFKHVTVGDSSKLKVGQWVITVGHPGGYNPNRPPPLRLGRILSISRTEIRTDCTLIACDSGGPLFDLDGKLVGIHSRISRPLTANIHVPINTFRDTWDRLVAGEEWGSNIFGFDFSRPRNAAYLGLGFTRGADDLIVAEVKEGHGSEKAGVKVGDKIVAVDGKKVTKRSELTAAMSKKKANDEVELELLRDGKTLKVKVKLGRRPAE